MHRERKKRKEMCPCCFQGAGHAGKKTFGGPAPESGYSVHHTADGGSVAVGYSFASNKQEPDLWIMRLNFWGEKIWEKSFSQGGAVGHAIVATWEGGCLVGKPGLSADAPAPLDIMENIFKPN